MTASFCAHNPSSWGPVDGTQGTSDSESGGWTRTGDPSHPLEMGPQKELLLSYRTEL